jgi:HlyD family secretion protein
VPLILLLLAAAAYGAWYYSNRQPVSIVITGIVTTDEVIVSSQIQGRIEALAVDVGDKVTKGQLIAKIEPEQWQADMQYYDKSQQQMAADLAQSKADLENAQLNFDRVKGLFASKVDSQQDYDVARTSYDSAAAHVNSIERQMQAVDAQKDKAKVYLDYTEINAPVAGIVDTRAALQGEVVNPGQAIVTLVNQDDLWVRADIEETYIDRIHLGDKMKVTLPSGAEREGVVFFRGVDADFATQRDVSRTKRDIKTFEIRLRCDNADRSLALGMTAYVTLPLNQK